MTYRMVRLPSGREVGMTGLGDPAGERLAVLVHPTPGASGFDPAPDVTSRSGIHLLSFERPGYGATEPAELSVSEWVDDLAGYLREAEAGARSATQTAYGHVGVVGWREGGIYAAALAARHPELVDRLALVAAPAPSRAGAVPQPRPSAPQPVAVGAVGEPLGYRDRLGRMLDAASTQGDAGVQADRHAFQATDAVWRTDAEALILYGSGDDYATVHDARWFAAGMPNARVERVDGGADIIGRHWDRVIAFLTA
ncbi:alpha/beta fold hydrolase [Leifsonia sp. 2MCAF36]|uniref:alpha/beta fold hydrolase n=1 Tax=Leifsonia sp. 2MCAF36 TaxID=3232988 RepID=UPI003F98505B